MCYSTERFEDKDLYIAMTPFLYAERDRRFFFFLIFFLFSAVLTLVNYPELNWNMGSVR